MSCDPTRRGFLRAGLAGVLSAAAGCVSAPEGRNRASALESENARLRRRLRVLSRRAAALEERSIGTEFAPAVRERARAVGERVRTAVVVIQRESRLASGTGWFLEGGHLVTNAHVLDELGPPFTCRTIDGAEFEATVVGRSGADGPAPDLAVLSTAFDPPATLPPGDSTALESGQPVVQVGHTRVGYWSITLGEVVRRIDLEDKAWVLTEIPTMLGNSGSPLVTLDGDVVGVTFGTIPRGDTPPSRAPTPGPPTVYEEYPRQATVFGAHVAIETIERAVRRWTG